MPHHITIPNLLGRIARGKHGAEFLNQEEAKNLFSELLQNDADPLQLGAFLIAQRMKGESAEELAGFTKAARSFCLGYQPQRAPNSSVEIPCFAGKQRATALHLIAAIRASEQHKIPILIHGMEHIEGRRSAWDLLKKHSQVQRATSIHHAHDLMQQEKITYLDLAESCPALYRLIQLRQKLGVRTFANSVARLLNPLNCSGQINGVFHTPYVMRLADVNHRLQQPRSLIFMGAEGEPELYADRQKLIAMQTGERLDMVQYDDSNHEPYPRQTVAKLSNLDEDFARIINGIIDNREQSVLTHMQHAIQWAAGGEFPPHWSRS
ncbi:MAG: anthranilate phosphoribosyltransferase [Zetaproteobacteria bacterium]|nr:anthranilate phosphoribosyltransferase [Zetaproteobacteria bacterium]